MEGIQTQKNLVHGLVQNGAWIRSRGEDKAFVIQCGDAESWLLTGMRSCW